ncbi:cyclic pyranopterin monophosphate synthase subunit MoaC [Desulfacinum infernum DSM 9756]|uniref:Cyclic pyranopterin monophosphate synthase n=1 Tax=Desulfacinum infernum DSM 9756 TaxID=1121391 RepID=A0A1M4XN28_9BACT|nr:cyclic pyranopterin monophosphate synthase MoaC [Desulfacinum infernum]SHE94612.1 cyclic pyranopterin monophosphate synthase subunit MoaC [Desulfacinum infernum DSM 9756]
MPSNDHPWTHLDEKGRLKMVDVSDKAPTWREARAVGRVLMAPETLRRIREGEVTKGNVLEAARLAGIMAAKRTWELIPLCHPIPLTAVEVSFEADPDLPGIRIRARTKTCDRTGVEMEALTAVTHAALTIYDMCKALDRTMCLDGIRLVHKSGGRSGTFSVEEDS